MQFNGVLCTFCISLKLCHIFSQKNYFQNNCNFLHDYKSVTTQAWSSSFDMLLTDGGNSSIPQKSLNILLNLTLYWQNNCDNNCGTCDITPTILWMCLLFLGKIIHLCRYTLGLRSPQLVSDDTKLCGGVSTLEGREGSWTGWGSDSVEPHKFNKAKWKVLHLGEGNPSTGWVENELGSALRRNSWVCRQTRSWTWAGGMCSQPKKPILSWAASKGVWSGGQGMGFCHSTQLSWVDTTWSAVFSSASPKKEDMDLLEWVKRRL